MFLALALIDIHNLDLALRIVALALAWHSSASPVRRRSKNGRLSGIRPNPPGAGLASLLGSSWYVFVAVAETPSKSFRLTESEDI